MLLEAGLREAGEGIVARSVSLVAARLLECPVSDLDHAYQRYESDLSRTHALDYLTERVSEEKGEAGGRGAPDARRDGGLPEREERLKVRFAVPAGGFRRDGRPPQLTAIRTSSAGSRVCGAEPAGTAHDVFDTSFHSMPIFGEA